MMKRRAFLGRIALTAGLPICANPILGPVLAAEPAQSGDVKLDPALARNWLDRWTRNIIADSSNRYCDHESGEEVGWMISPFLDGFYYGYLATGDEKWIVRFVDWADAWINRGTTGPDGYTGWPKQQPAGSQEAFLTDSLLGEAMALRPLVMMATEIRKTPVLKERFEPRATAYLQLAERMFEKWSARGCWRETKAGGLWVSPDFGVDQQTGQWTAGYARRQTTGLSEPANKQSQIALWLLAMHSATGKTIYKTRCEQWWRLLKSRIRTQQGGKYCVWNYWEPGGSWDYKMDGSTRHWVGVHPNGAYYALDVDGIVAAFEHGLVFTQQDIDRLIATNRDFMWNQKVQTAEFQRIDGGRRDLRRKVPPGLLWAALTPHDKTLKKVFLANHKPDIWSSLSITPWFLSRFKE